MTQQRRPLGLARSQPHAALPGLKIIRAMSRETARVDQTVKNIKTTTGSTTEQQHFTHRVQHSLIDVFGKRTEHGVRVTVTTRCMHDMAESLYTIGSRWRVE